MVEKQGVYAYLVSIDTPEVIIPSKEELKKRIRIVPVWDLYFSLDKIPFPNVPFAWKTMPLIHIGNPQIAVDMNGESSMIFTIEFSKDVISGGKVVKHPGPFIELAKSMVAWLEERSKG